MLGKTGWNRLVAVGLTWAVMCTSGCLQHLHPIEPLRCEEVREQQDINQCQKNKVYIFQVHGLADPCDSSNFSGLDEYLRSLGYIKAYYGAIYHSIWFEKELRRIHEADPGAHFVLIGFSAGATAVRDVACNVRLDPVPIDLLVYVDPVPVDGQALIRPPNVKRVINLLSSPRSSEAAVKQGENHRFDDVWHYGMISHPQTLRILVRELSAIARTVPVVVRMPPELPPVPGEIPGKATPAVVPAPLARGKSGEWEFLCGDSDSLGAPGAKPIAEAYATPPGGARGHD